MTLNCHCWPTVVHTERAQCLKSAAAAQPDDECVSVTHSLTDGRSVCENTHLHERSQDV